MTLHTNIGILQVCFEIYGQLDDVVSDPRLMGIWLAEDAGIQRIESTANVAVCAAVIRYRRKMDAELACTAFNNTR